MSDRNITAEERIGTFRRIVRNHQFERVRVDAGRARVVVDAFTAQAVVTVYDALSPEAQLRYRSMPMLRMVDVAWKVLAKSRAAV